MIESPPWAAIFNIKKNFLEELYLCIDFNLVSGIEEIEFNNNEVKLKIYFFKKNKAFEEKITKKFKIKQILWKKISFNEDNWQEKWKQHYTPLEFSGFTIVPPWLKEQQKKEKPVIVINPGLGFGTGRHESTQIAAYLLRECFSWKKYKNFLDLGAGSGILSFFMEKMGQKNIDSVEIDVDAIENAKGNILLNKSKEINLVHGLLNSIAQKYELIVANIIAETLIELYEDIKTHSLPQGILVLSGIYHKFQREVEACYVKDFEKIKNYDLGEWGGIIFQKRKT